jgi:hypothetical protein
MATEDGFDVMDDIRWSTLCHHLDCLMSEHKMTNLERINVGSYIVASVVKNMPPSVQFRWFAYVVHEICSSAADLSLQPIAEKVPA